VDSVIRYFEQIGVQEDDEDIIYKSVLRLREQRMSLVQTLTQYVRCYECVLHYLLGRVAGGTMGVEE